MINRYKHHFHEALSASNWVQELQKATTQQDCLRLLVLRILETLTNGPFCVSSNGELPVDIVITCIERKILDRELIEKTVQSAMVLLLENKFATVAPSVEQQLSLWRNFFHTALHLKLETCLEPIVSWIVINKDFLKSAHQPQKQAMEMALYAFAHLQEEKQEYEELWLNAWGNSYKYFWTSIFYGLLIQNYNTAAGMLPMLIERKMDNTPQLLSIFWRLDEARECFENTLNAGLDADDHWAGLAMNQLASRLSNADQLKLLIGLRTRKEAETKPEINP